MSMPLMMQTIDRALKDRAPRLYRQMQESGELLEFLQEKAGEANSEIVTRVMARAKTNGLPYLEHVRELNRQDQRATEEVIAEVVASLPDERSSPSLG